MEPKKHTLCWDCAHYAQGCSWSEYFRPVRGWNATKVKTKYFNSYIVHDCPKFERDSYNFGLTRPNSPQIKYKQNYVERPSKAQLTYIGWIRENADRMIPIFDGETAEDAKQYIIKYRDAVPIKRPEVKIYDKHQPKKCGRKPVARTKYWVEE